jgi:hypothetical protein
MRTKLKKIMFFWGNVKEKDQLENLGVDGRIILKHLKEIELGGRGLDISGSG